MTKVVISDAKNMHSEPMNVQIASFRLSMGSDVRCASCAESCSRTAAVIERDSSMGRGVVDRLVRPLEDGERGEQEAEHGDQTKRESVGLALDHDADHEDQQAD